MPSLTLIPNTGIFSGNANLIQSKGRHPRWMGGSAWNFRRWLQTLWQISLVLQVFRILMFEYANLGHLIKYSL